MKTAYDLSEDLMQPLKIEQINFDQINQGGKTNMTKISEYAKDYEPQQKTKNIADLSEVSTDLEVEDDDYEFTDNKTNETKTVKQKVIEVEGEKYRVPITVIQQLKVFIEDNPELKKFKVKKSGSTKDDTSYTVIPIVKA